MLSEVWVLFSQGNVRTFLCETYILISLIVIAQLLTVYFNPFGMFSYLQLRIDEKSSLFGCWVDRYIVINIQISCFVNNRI